jgi:hypothetical protein
MGVIYVWKVVHCGKIILRWIFRKWDGGMEWIVRTLDRGSWWALVNAVMNNRVPYIAENFLTSLETIIISRRTLLHEVNK